MHRPIACLCVMLFAGAQQPAGDPLAGHWQLNVGRTHYGGGAEPRTKESFDCSVEGARVSCTIESVMASGKTVHARFSAAYGGPPGTADGIPDFDHVRLVKISTTIADATFTHEGRAVFAYRAVRSSDGRSLTIISVDPVTRAVLNSVVVYDAR